MQFLLEGKGREGKGREGKGREGKGREGKGPTRSLPPCPNLISRPLIYPTGIGRSSENLILLLFSCF
ncbi:MAG: hypothetical protein DPW13_14760 [Planctomycetes bacterium]|nr:hypothetical protein [Planctomycetota bacterium]